MQISEFVEATSRIELYYGKEYTTEQREIMYDELKNMTIERYRQLISVVLKKCEYKPKIADFFMADAELPSIKKEEENKTYECQKCKGNGYVIYKKIIDDGGRKFEYSYAARCDCPNGEDKPSIVPMITQIGLNSTNLVAF